MSYEALCALCEKTITIPPQLDNDDHNWAGQKTVDGKWVEIWECRDCMKLPYDDIVALRVARALKP